MEKRLKGLFAYQKFEGNSKLDKLIAETESRVGVSLNDDELDMVNAAGTKLPPHGASVIIPVECTTDS